MKEVRKWKKKKRAIAFSAVVRHNFSFIFQGSRVAWGVGLRWSAFAPFTIEEMGESVGRGTSKFLS